MVVIDGTSITMTRGDTLCVSVEMVKVDPETKEEQEYVPSEGEYIRFALKTPKMVGSRTEYKDPEPLILKEIPIETCQLVLQPSDTKPLGFGNYVYDIEITMEDGTVDTFISEATFILSPEVY